MNEWNIQSRGHVCEACGKSFANHETFHTVLCDARRDFRRSDICVACWKKDYSENARERKGFISYWHGVYEAPVAAPEVIQKDTAETLLRKLVALNDPRYVPAGYILAVMLERKRLLKVKEQFTREGRRVFIYEHPKTGDIFTIVDPNLQLNQLAEVQHDVARLLEHGLDTPTPTPAPTPATTPPPAAADPVLPPDTLNPGTTTAEALPAATAA